MNTLQYDYDNLPELPFNVYFLDQDGQVSPKRIYTVTRKRMGIESHKIELYVLELDQYIVYDEEKVIRVAEMCVNDIYIRYR